MPHRSIISLAFCTSLSRPVVGGASEAASTPQQGPQSLANPVLVWLPLRLSGLCSMFAPAASPDLPSCAA